MFFSGLATRCPPMKRFVKGHILAVVCVLFVIMEAPRTVLPHFERWYLQLLRPPPTQVSTHYYSGMEEQGFFVTLGEKNVWGASWYASCTPFTECLHRHSVVHIISLRCGRCRPAPLALILMWG